MPLDNAQFIAELSVTDPPGTDPLNQGDDHIRTTKLAVQQSFPLIDAAVPITAAQMAQMAIKNEVNIFTQQQTFQQKLNAADGDAVNPSYNFTNRDAGMYASAGNRLNWATAGVQRAFLDASQFQVLVQINATNGSVGAPGYAFANDTGTGMFRDTAGRISWATVGGLRAILQADQFQTLVQMRTIDGIETAPGYAFTSDPGTGMYASATSCNLTANGQLIASFTSSSDIFANVGRSWAGNSLRDATRPAFNFNSDPDTGFYNAGANSIGVAAAGVSIGTMDTSAYWMANGVSIHGDGASVVGNPAFAFTNDTDTGFSRKQANIASIIAGGVEVVTVGTGGFGVRSGTPTFLSLPTSPGTSTSLWNDNGTVKVA